MKKLFALSLALMLALTLPIGALAGGALGPEETPVTFAALSGYSDPRPGDEVSAHLGITVPDGAHYNIQSRLWFRMNRERGAWDTLSPSDVFESGEIYYMGIRLMPISGYAFSESCGVSLNSGSVPIRLSRSQGGINVSTRYLVCGEGHTLIDRIDVRGFELPVYEESIGDHLSLTVPDGAHYSVIVTAWLVGPLESASPAFPIMEFENGVQYTETAVVIPDPGYAFAENCRLFADGSEMAVNHGYSYCDPGAAVIYGRTLVCGEPEFIPGDANQNGRVETDDALLILRHALNISLLPESALPIIDLDGDGAVTTADALYALRTALGIMG